MAPEVRDENTLALREREQEEVDRRIRAQVVHETIRREGEDELRRPSQALAWSGLAAGLSMGFSLVGEGLLRAHLPAAPWRPVVTKLGYSIGFLVVVLGRQQLFTENTLTPVLPLLRRSRPGGILNLARLWTVVLLANLTGAAIFAWAAGNTGAARLSSRLFWKQAGRPPPSRSATPCCAAYSRAG